MSVESAEATTDAPRPTRRRRLDLSVRALMIIVLVVGGGLGWIAYHARVQRDAVATIRHFNKGDVGYNSSWSLRGPWPPPRKSSAPAWLQRSLGAHYFDTVTSVQFSEAGMKPKPGGDEVMRAACKLTELEALSIVHTDATDAGAEGLGGLTRLKSLDLRMNPGMTARSMKDFGRLTELRELKLATIPVRNEDMGFLRKLAKLESLTIPGRGTTLTGTWMENIENLTNLRYLQLYDMAITADGLRHLRGLTSLGVLTLHGAKVDRLDSLRPLANLGVIGLYGNPVDDDDMVALRDLPNIYSLDLRKTKITDRGVATLAALLTLSELDLGETDVTDAALVNLAKMPKLATVNVRKTRMTAGALDAFQVTHPSIGVSR